MGTYRPADRGAEQISSASITVCGDRLRERLTAEECTIRGVHVWLHVEQASGCHRSDGELSHIYDNDIKSADELYSIGFIYCKKRKETFP